MFIQLSYYSIWYWFYWLSQPRTNQKAFCLLSNLSDVIIVKKRLVCKISSEFLIQRKPSNGHRPSSMLECIDKHLPLSISLWLSKSENNTLDMLSGGSTHWDWTVFQIQIKTLTSYNQLHFYVCYLLCQLSWSCHSWMDLSWNSKLQAWLGTKLKDWFEIVFLQLHIS